MNTVLDYSTVESKNTDPCTDYDTWFRAKVQQAIDSKVPRIAHDDIVAEMDSLIAEIEASLTV